MRLDRSKRKLDVDIKNTFNEACRVSAGEDLANSEHLVDCRRHNQFSF